MSCSCSCFIPCYISFSKVSLSFISYTRFNARVSCYRGKAEEQTACRIRNLYASSFVISSGLQGQQLPKALAARYRVTAAPYTSVPEARLYITVRVFHSFCVHHPTLLMLCFCKMSIYVGGKCRMAENSVLASAFTRTESRGYTTATYNVIIHICLKYHPHNCLTCSYCLHIV